MSLDQIQSVMCRRIEQKEKDTQKIKVFQDAIKQADTVEELGLLALLPGKLVHQKKSNTDVTVIYAGSVSCILTLSKIAIAKYELYSIGGGIGGIGENHVWHTIPHNIGEISNGEWRSVEKTREYGKVVSFRITDKNQVHLHYITYQKKPIRCLFSKQTLSVNDVSHRVQHIHRFLTRDWFRPMSVSSSEWLHNIKWFHSADRGAYIRIRFLKENTVFTAQTDTFPENGSVFPCVNDQDNSVWKLAVLETSVHVSDTSGNAMFFPIRFELSKDQTSYLIESQYPNSIIYLPNGNMDWMGIGIATTKSKHRKHIACIIESHHFQSVQEVLTTTLQLAGFVDHRDDDTRNDWELFRP